MHPSAAGELASKILGYMPGGKLGLVRISRLWPELTEWLDARLVSREQ